MSEKSDKFNFDTVVVNGVTYEDSLSVYQKKVLELLERIANK